MGGLAGGHLEGQASPLTVGGHQLLQRRVLLDLELDDVPVLAHHLADGEVREEREERGGRRGGKAP